MNKEEQEILDGLIQNAARRLLELVMEDTASRHLFKVLEQQGATGIQFLNVSIPTNLSAQPGFPPPQTLIAVIAMRMIVLGSQDGILRFILHRLRDMNVLRVVIPDLSFQFGAATEDAPPPMSESRAEFVRTMTRLMQA